MAPDPARVGNKLAAVGNGFAASGQRWWHSSWVMALLQGKLFLFSFWKDKAACWKNVALGASCSQLSGFWRPWRKGKELRQLGLFSLEKRL